MATVQDRSARSCPGSRSSESAQLEALDGLLQPATECKGRQSSRLFVRASYRNRILTDSGYCASKKKGLPKQPPCFLVLARLGQTLAARGRLTTSFATGTSLVPSPSLRCRLRRRHTPSWCLLPAERWWGCRSQPSRTCRIRGSRSRASKRSTSCFDKIFLSAW